MGNCCRIYTKMPVEEAKEMVGNHPAVLRWGKNAIVPASDSYFGGVPEEYVDGYTEINLINSINVIQRCIEYKGEIAQDLDAYGMNTVLSLMKP